LSIVTHPIFRSRKEAIPTSWDAGDKVILGLVQASSENATVGREFLKSLVVRGFRYEQGLLVVVDGSKGASGGGNDVRGLRGDPEVSPA
jgi:hypothetical protein